MHVIQDYKHQIAKYNKIKLVYDDEEHYAKDNVRILVQADKHRINQVISNLVSNSAKFTNEGGSIPIKIKSDNDDHNAIAIRVKDTGTGIDPKIMPKLFTKFAKKSDTGTGLGLIISKNIVEAFSIFTVLTSS